MESGARQPWTVHRTGDRHADDPSPDAVPVEPGPWLGRDCRQDHSFCGAATATAAAGTAVANNPGTQDVAGSLLFGLNADSIGQIIGDASPGLSEAQSTVAAKVVSGIMTRASASNDLGSSIGNVANLSDFVTNRVNNIQKTLTGDQFVARLQRQGLTQTQATQTAIVTQAKQIQQQATDATAAAAKIARQAAITAAWGSLLAAVLIIGASTFGGNRAANTWEKIASKDGRSARVWDQVQ